MGTEKSSWQVCPVTIEAKIVGRRLLGFDLLLVVDTIRELGDMHHHFYWFAWLQRDIWLKIIMCGLPRGNGWVVTHSVNWKIKYQNTQCLTMFRRHTKKELLWQHNGWLLPYPKKSLAHPRVRFPWWHKYKHVFKGQQFLPYTIGFQIKCGAIHYESCHQHWWIEIRWLRVLHQHISTTFSLRKKNGFCSTCQLQSHL